MRWQHSCRSPDAVFRETACGFFNWKTGRMPRPSFRSRRTFLMLKVGMPGLPCLSTVKMVTGLTSFLLQWFLKNGLRLPQPRTIRRAYCLSPAGPAPQGAVPPRQCYPAVLYPPHTSPNPAGMFNAAAQCGGRVEYPPVPVRTVHVPYTSAAPGHICR